MSGMNPNRIVKCMREIAAVSSNKNAARGLNHVSREMEMIPKYLELASINGKDRFTQQEIRSITKVFDRYETNLSKTDIVKDLLAIGKERGSVLSTDEVIGFLNATSGMKQLEQRNVLNFVKTAKERVPKNFSVEEYKRSFPYEEFKVRYIKNHADTPLAKHIPDFFSEKSIHKAYEIAVDNTVRINSNPYYHAILNDIKVNPADYIIKHPNKAFIESVSKISDSEKLLTIINSVGVNPNTIAAAEDLLKLFDLSKHNLGLVTDLAKDFYPAEIKQIAEILSKEIKAGGANKASDYAMWTSKFADGTGLSSERYHILKELGVNGKINMLPLKTYVDAYNPMSKITGNFEGGKRRK